MSEPNYLPVAEVLAIHSVLVQRYGGTAGVRDPGALESAVARPSGWILQRHNSGSDCLFERLAIKQALR